MARSPFQGTWVDGVRPTVVTAPDALVYINGRPDLTACTNCRRSFDLNKYITSLQVDLNVNNAPGSANFSLSVPRHSIDDFCVDGEPIITNMMEVEMYAKGYYLVNGMPQYYPIFWGMITDVSHTYSGGEETFNVSCADILKWWELCRLNINPALTQASGQTGRNITGNAFDGCNVYDVMWTLAQQAMGDVIQAKGSATSVVRESFDEAGFAGLRKDIMAYWNARFGKMRSSLVLYGIRGAAVRGDEIYSTRSSGTLQAGQTYASRAVRNANGGSHSGQILFDPINDVIPFRSVLANTGAPNHWESEFQTKLELANTCKEAVGFEFFMDVTGDLVFKPPFYNLDTFSNKPVSWVQDIDVIDWDFSESESEVITQLQIQGTAEGGSMDTGVTAEVNTPYTQVTDFHLLRQYGSRPQSFNADFLQTNEARFYAGLDMLDRINSRRHRATINIPLRPELRLGFPVYIAPKDQIWYLSGISHNIQFGGRAQTTLTLTAKRSKFIAPKGIGTIELTSFNRPVEKPSAELVKKTTPNAQELSRSGKFKIKVGSAAETPPTTQQTGTLGDGPYSPLILRHPKTGRIVGYPNVNMAYTRPYAPTAAERTRDLGQNASAKAKAERMKGKGNGTASKANDDLVSAAFVQNEERALIEKHLNNRYSYGMTSAGVYTYVHDLSKSIQEIIQLPTTSIEVSSMTGTTLNPERESGTATIRPVSDERGFEVVGHFRYGRGISLRDGALVLSDGTARVPVDTQLALSGGLFEALTAQSQGLTTLSSTYGNPAHTIARMTVEDSQTGATLNPTTGQAELTTGEQFITNAPLNSAANQGEWATVEASQLSRALTIAEMTVKDYTVPSEQCNCLLGRSDLAFISVGYQVKFLKGTQFDNSGSVGDAVRRSEVEINRLEAEMAEHRKRHQSEIDEARANSRFLAATAPSAERDAKMLVLQTRLAQLQAPLTDGAARVETLQVAIQARKSEEVGPNSEFIGDTVVRGTVEDDTLPLVDTARPMTATLTVSRVEKFLADLYEALDGPHQQLEDTLRGNLIDSPTREAMLSGTAFPADRLSPFSPPFSAGNRALGGDPKALALQGSSAMGGLKQSWKDFGEDLVKEPQMKLLGERIANLESSLREVDAEEERLKVAQKSGSIIASPDGSMNERLERLTKVRADKTRDLANSRAKLRQLETGS